MEGLIVGDRVMWKDHLRRTDHDGDVVAIIPQYINPTNIWNEVSACFGYRPVSGPGSYRDHLSYIIHVPSLSGLYWPQVKNLVKLNDPIT